MIDTERMETVLDSPYVPHRPLRRSPNLEGSATGSREGPPVGQAALGDRRGVDGEALAALIVNKIRGTFKSAAQSRLLSFGDRRRGDFFFLAILSGGQVINEEDRLKLDNVTLKLLGQGHQVDVIHQG